MAGVTQGLSEWWNFTNLGGNIRSIACTNCDVKDVNLVPKGLKTYARCCGKDPGSGWSRDTLKSAVFLISAPSCHREGW